MPRVWHQPSLGKENIWMFHHLEHGKCLGTTFLLLPVLLWRHHIGGSKPNMVTLLSQHGLISSRFCYLALDITAVTLSSLKEELTLLSRAPNRLGSTSLAISSLCVFGLVDFSIKTYFFRYAKYAIKSDYWNLMFEACLRFFYLKATWNSNKFHFPFWF